MLDERTLIQNQFEKIHSLDIEKNPLNYFFYSNGVHLLCIKRSRVGYALCGLQTGFHVLFSQHNLDVYYTSPNLQDCVKQFERFISLLLLPRRFEEPLQNELY